MPAQLLSAIKAWYTSSCQYELHSRNIGDLSLLLLCAVMNDQALKAFIHPYTFWPQVLAAHHNPFHIIVELHKDMQQARGS